MGQVGDLIGAVHAAKQLLKKVVFFVGQLFPAYTSDCLRATSINRCLNTLDNGLNGLVPTYFLESSTNVYKGGLNAIFIVDNAMSKASLGAKISFVDSQVICFVTNKPSYSILFCFHLNCAAPRAVTTSAVVCCKQCGQPTLL